MFGFRALALQGAKMLARSSTFKLSVCKPQHITWSHQQISNALIRCQPIPGAGLTLLNLRQILEKCSSESDVEPEKTLNGNILSEQSNVLSRVSTRSMTLALRQIIDTKPTLI